MRRSRIFRLTSHVRKKMAGMLGFVVLLSSATHESNFGVIVDTSRFWFNYRHVANSLSIYHTMKRLGVPDSNIILMIADDASCDPRNIFPSRMYSKAPYDLNIYDSDIEVDYRGSEVTVENFLRVLTGRHHESTSPKKRLLTDSKSNVLVYLTGHGGDGFLKFQDREILNSQDLADAFEQMRQQRRYHEVLFMIDTCQAASMFGKFYSPSIVGVASSLVGENSYAHGTDSVIGVSLSDRFTFFLLQWLESLSTQSNPSLADMIINLRQKPLMSTANVRTDLFNRSATEIRIMDYFANGKVEALVLDWEYPFPEGSPLHAT